LIRKIGKPNVMGIFTIIFLLIIATFESLCMPPEALREAIANGKFDVFCVKKNTAPQDLPSILAAIIDASEDEVQQLDQLIKNTNLKSNLVRVIR
jgi:hypothetical protein